MSAALAGAAAAWLTAAVREAAHVANVARDRPVAYTVLAMLGLAWLYLGLVTAITLRQLCGRSSPALWRIAAFAASTVTVAVGFVTAGSSQFEWATYLKHDVPAYAFGIAIAATFFATPARSQGVASGEPRLLGASRVLSGVALLSTATLLTNDELAKAGISWVAHHPDRVHLVGLLPLAIDGYIALSLFASARMSQAIVGVVLLGLPYVARAWARGDWPLWQWMPPAAALMLAWRFREEPASGGAPQGRKLQASFRAVDREEL